MCIISVLPKGTVKYNDKVIKFTKNGMECNSQGSGYMFKRNGENTITVDKGYFILEKLLESIESRNLGLEDELVIHHRISTSGKVSGENSHPFVISDIHEEVCATNITIGKPCLVHNGVFSYLYDYMNKNKDFSDTYALTRYILGNKHIWSIFEEDRELGIKLIEKFTNSSRIAILHPNKDLEMIGTFHDDDGYHHSNLGYCNSVFDRGGSSNRNTVVYDPGNYYGAYARQNKPTSNFSEWNEGYGRDVYDDTPEDTSVFNNASDDIDNARREWRNPDSNVTSEADKKDMIASKTYIDDEGAKVFLLTLDSSLVNITEDNFKHFYFVAKKDYFNQLNGDGLELWRIDEYNKNCLTQSLVNKEERGESYISTYDAIGNIRLAAEYFYIPKKDYVLHYEQLQFLIKNIKDVGISTLHKVESIINSKLNKSNEYIIKWKRPEVESQFITLLSLKLFRTYIQGEIGLKKERARYEVMG